MSELTLTLIRLGLLVLLWILVFSIVGVLRTDLFGTRVSRRSQRASARARRGSAAPASATAVTPHGAAAAPPLEGTGRAAAAPPRGQPRALRQPTTLTVTAGRLAGSTLPLRQSVVLIGRNPECTLVVDDDFASGRHARIFARPEGWFVEDLGSTNGTYLDGTRLGGTQPVGAGTQLRIGRTVLELRG